MEVSASLNSVRLKVWDPQADTLTPASPDPPLPQGETLSLTYQPVPAYLKSTPGRSRRLWDARSLPLTESDKQAVCTCTLEQKTSYRD